MLSQPATLEIPSISDKFLKNRVQIADLCLDFAVLHQAYQAIQVYTSDDSTEAVHLSCVIQVLNYRYESLLKRFEDLI